MREILTEEKWRAMEKAGSLPPASEYMLIKPVRALVSPVALEAGDAGEESRLIDFVISTETPDRYRDVISAEGWDLEAYKANPVVLWAHSYHQPPVGRAVDVQVDGKQLKARDEFVSRDLYPFGYMIFQMYREKFLNAVSVGFLPQEWSYDEERGGYNFLASELLEHSAVPVPANAEALQEALAKGIDLQPLREWALRALDLSFGEDARSSLWVPRSLLETVESKLRPTGLKVYGFEIVDSEDIVPVELMSRDLSQERGSPQETPPEGEPGGEPQEATKSGDEPGEMGETTTPAPTLETLNADLGEMTAVLAALGLQFRELAEKVEKINAEGVPVRWVERGAEETPPFMELEVGEVDDEPAEAVLLVESDEPESEGLILEIEEEELRESIASIVGRTLMERTGKVPDKI